ncbi:MAG: hypothetical protein U0V70_19355 [Terriglobia bacterium]
MRQPKPTPAGARIPIRLSRRERELILHHSFVDGDVERRLRVARSASREVVADLTLDDLDDLLGSIAAEANHATSRMLQKELDGLFDRLKKIEDLYIDHE